MQLVEIHCTCRQGLGGGGVCFTIEKKTVLNMVKLCVIPEKNTILPPRISIPEGSSLNSHYLEFPIFLSGLNSQYM